MDWRWQVQMGSLRGAEFGNLELRQPDCAVWALVSASHFIKQHSTSISTSSNSCPSEQCGKTKTAVRVSSFSCSHSSAAPQHPRSHQIFRRMLQTFVSQPQMPCAQVWIPLGSCSCYQKIVRKLERALSPNGTGLSDQLCLHAQHTVTAFQCLVGEN